MTALVGALVEAWTELRIHRTRVLLSLIGVAVAVAALTAVMAFGAVAEQAQIEQSEKYGGRPALLQSSAYDLTGSTAPDPEALAAAYDTGFDRYGIGFSSRVYFGATRVQFADGVRDVSVTAVDPEYGSMHRIDLLEGSWFSERDTQRLAPAAIVSEDFWNLLGRPALATHPVFEMPGTPGATAVVVGVTPSPGFDEGPVAYLLADDYLATLPPVQAAQQQAQFEAWVPPELADELTTRLQRDVAGALGDGFQVDVYRTDYLAYTGDGDPFLITKLLVGGVAVLVLLLGALSLVNISLVTMRQRIREIGIRRSFGATAGRVFFAVMMESVVATVVAGVAGVAVAILLFRLPFVTDLIAQGVTDAPAFPLDAALLGLAASVAVGALAGLLPALVAVRVKVIDAIRY
jgi:putative ABC transport system permease protein